MKLTESMVVDRWHILLDGCSGDGQDFFQEVHDKLTAYAVPGLKWSIETVSSGGLRGLPGRHRRDMVVVRDDHLTETRVCIGARDYGAYFLDISWYLVVHPDSVSRVASAVVGEGLLRSLSLFDQQDCRAFAKATRRAIEQAIDGLKGRSSSTPHSMSSATSSSVFDEDSP